MTPPPLLETSALVGQTFMHGGFEQALQATTTKPLSIPPADLILSLIFQVRVPKSAGTSKHATLTTNAKVSIDQG